MAPATIQIIIIQKLTIMPLVGYWVCAGVPLPHPLARGVKVISPGSWLAPLKVRMGEVAACKVGIHGGDRALLDSSVFVGRSISQ